ncbi:hypothetical protein EI546_01745 [Aequorivita sp. H23M31]|uniref:DUF4136 domain-containing protein n=1 Tax=Aequorivita ciconiae TaxID=2494375 RepID=A0A410FZT3_9FLAO|nr:hypothetical protein [Aequorivita sp. H23M31]QAA80528.1 hypothetical protein EI546_01745 [Aequorivita sp. H23M31]
MKLFFSLTVVGILLASCASSRLIEQYANPETTEFRPQKILVVGLTPDGGLQREFEYSMVLALENQNIKAEKSVDLYGEPFTINEDASGKLEISVSELRKAGFDAVIFSKITGRERRVSLAQSYRNLASTLETFDDYYNENRSIHKSEDLEGYPVLITETSLYCLCPDKNNDLVWRGSIEVKNTQNSRELIRDYVNTLQKTLRKKGFFGRS